VMFVHGALGPVNAGVKAASWAKPPHKSIAIDALWFLSLWSTLKEDLKGLGNMDVYVF